MRARLLILMLGAVPAILAAQAPAVKIALQVDPPPTGTPPLDTASIVQALNGLVKEAGIVDPPPSGDGWILEIRAVPMELHDGLLIADTPMRLSRIQGGQKVPEDSKHAESVTAAMTVENLDSHAGKDIADRARLLLETAKVIPAMKAPQTTVNATPGTLGSENSAIQDFKFSEVRVAHQPPQPPYPPAAKMNRVQGKVVVVVVIGPDGLPETANAIEGPGPLLAYALEYVMKWRFEPLRFNGKPEWARFKINLDFRLQ